jgi:glucose-1-phosphate thymidylyltransferase
MKGVILIAGRGTRLKPFSLSQPKTLLPVANKPVLFYCMERLIEIGIMEIGIVVNRSQLEPIVDRVAHGEPFGANVKYFFQDQPQGIAHALKSAESFVADEPFILMLGDNLIEDSLSDLKQKVERKQTNASLMLAEVERPQDYGVAEVENDKITRLEEKPKQSKSNLGVIGVYAFDSTIFKAINAISPSARGEYEITDAIQWLITHGYKVSYTIAKNAAFDVGTVQRWIEANRSQLDKSASQECTNTITNSRIIPPVIIGSGSVIKDSVIGPYVSVGEGSHIERCHIQNSIVLEKADIRDIRKIVKDSVFGRNSRVIGSQGDFESGEYILGDQSSMIEKKSDKEYD